MSDELIRRLVLDLQPVNRLERPIRRSVRFALLAGLATAIEVLVVGTRADLVGKLLEPIYLTETAILLVLFSGATFAALCSGVPGVKLSAATWLVVLAAGAWLLIVGHATGGEAQAVGLVSGAACVRRTLLLATLPGLLLFAMLRRSVPLEAKISGAFAMVSAGALAVLGTRLLCAKDEAAHVLTWHIAPLAVLALLGWFIGRARFRGSTLTR
jgi:hypothetical protein